MEDDKLRQIREGMDNAFSDGDISQTVQDFKALANARVDNTQNLVPKHEESPEDPVTHEVHHKLVYNTEHDSILTGEHPVLKHDTPPMPSIPIQADSDILFKDNSRPEAILEKRADELGLNDTITAAENMPGGTSPENEKFLEAASQLFKHIEPIAPVDADMVMNTVGKPVTLHEGEPAEHVDFDAELNKLLEEKIDDPLRRAQLKQLIPTPDDVAAVLDEDIDQDVFLNECGDSPAMLLLLSQARTASVVARSMSEQQLNKAQSRDKLARSLLAFAESHIIPNTDKLLSSYDAAEASSGKMLEQLDRVVSDVRREYADAFRDWVMLRVEELKQEYVKTHPPVKQSEVEQLRNAAREACQRALIDSQQQLLDARYQLLEYVIANSDDETAVAARKHRATLDRINESLATAAIALKNNDQANIVFDNHGTATVQTEPVAHEEPKPEPEPETPPAIEQLKPETHAVVEQPEPEAVEENEQPEEVKEPVEPAIPERTPTGVKIPDHDLDLKSVRMATVTDNVEQPTTVFDQLDNVQSIEDLMVDEEPEEPEDQKYFTGVSQLKTDRATDVDSFDDIMHGNNDKGEEDVEHEPAPKPISKGKIIAATLAGCLFLGGTAFGVTGYVWPGFMKQKTVESQALGGAGKPSIELREKLKPVLGKYRVGDKLELITKQGIVKVTIVGFNVDGAVAADEKQSKWLVTTKQLQDWLESHKDEFINREVVDNLETVKPAAAATSSNEEKPTPMKSEGVHNVEPKPGTSH